MVETIVVKAFADLNGSERSRLLQLTKKGPSGFRGWLNDYDQSGKFASIHPSASSSLGKEYPIEF